MPRKSGTTKAPCDVKGIDGTITSLNPDSLTATINQRGGLVTRGAKRRRPSNNVNSVTNDHLGSSGIIVASNPFDDDHQTPNAFGSFNMKSSSKMLTSAPQQPNLLNTSHSHRYQHPSHHNLLHQQLHPTTHPTFHQAQQRQPQQNLPHQQPSAMYPHHNYVMQSVPPIQPQHFTHMSSPPVDHSLSNTSQIHQQVGHIQPPCLEQQHLPPVLHSGLQNQGQIMSTTGHTVSPHNQQNFTVLQNQQPPNPTHIATNQQSPMIGSATPPLMVGSGPPAPSHSPYMHPHVANSRVFQQQLPHHQTAIPQPPPSQTPTIIGHHNQESRSGHMETIPMQQHQGPYASDHAIYCGKCQRDIYHNEPNIMCKASCRSYFHLTCSGLSQLACDLLMKESMAEWVCDRCASGNRRVPLVKYKS